MALQVRITNADLLPDLVHALSRNGCVAHATGRTSCAVVHVAAADADEAWRELLFFVRAWRSQHEAVGAVLIH